MTVTSGGLEHGDGVRNPGKPGTSWVVVRNYPQCPGFTLKAKGDRFVSNSELGIAQAQRDRYIAEAVSKKEAIAVARQEMENARTLVAFHQIRCRVPGVIHQDYRQWLRERERARRYHEWLKQQPEDDEEWDEDSGEPPPEYSPGYHPRPYRPFHRYSPPRAPYRED